GGDGSNGGGSAGDVDGAGGGANASVTMVFPEYAPLDHILPRYLSTAVLRRLRMRGITVVGHSTLRYIGMDYRGGSVASVGAAAASDGGSAAARLRVFVARAYDFLETSQFSADRVFVAGLDAAPLTSLFRNNDSSGAAGSGGDFGKSCECSSSGDRSPDETSCVGLEIDGVNGGVVVNAELMASSRVWCAGDAASVPGPLGRAVHRSADHAYHSGVVAGLNMGVA
ncbi:unnamed protein product, partial [Phaeothamnion confervicola]